MGIESITNRLKAERRDVTVQTSISAKDSDMLDAFVEFLKANGVEANRSGAVRALLLDGLAVFEEAQAEAKPNPKAEALENLHPRVIRDEPQA